MTKSKQISSSSPPTAVRHSKWAAPAAIVSGAAFAGALLSTFDPDGLTLAGWLAYALLFGLGGASLLILQNLLLKEFAAEKRLPSVASWITFGARLAAGLALVWLLPVWGYQDADAVAGKAGYVFTDAYMRDQQAWDLALDREPLLDAFSGKYVSDQYGGLLWMSALIYRYLSPDLHRPTLVLLVGAVVAAWGAIFLWKGARLWFGRRTAKAAVWIYALYPEAVLLGASQMREPIVMAGIAAAFLALVEMLQNRRSWPFFLVFSGLVLFSLHPPSALATFIVLAGLWLFEPARRLSKRQALLMGSLIIAAVVVVFSVWATLPSLQGASPLQVFTTWLENNFNYQSHLTERATGMVQKVLRALGEQGKLPFILAYGVTRPVLPGALVDPAAPIWRVTNIFRSLGWYALAPFLFYGAWSAFRAGSDPRRRQLAWLGLVIWTWILIASANSGADMWDGPRYRAIFLPWQALLAGWCWEWVRERRDPWFKRWLWVELVYVLMFTEWYLGRQYPAFFHLDVFVMIGLALLATVLILGGGWLLDRRTKLRAGG